VAGKSPATSNGIKTMTSTNSVANVIKKFDQLDKPSTTEPSPQQPRRSTILPKPSLPFTSKSAQVNLNKSLFVPKAPTSPTKLKNKLISPSPINNNKYHQISSELPKRESSTTRHRLPSPSLLRKTQAVIAKEQSNPLLTKKTSPTAKTKLTFSTKSSLEKTNATKNSNSPPFNRKIKTNEKPKSDSFQKAAAFWNKQKA